MTRAIHTIIKFNRESVTLEKLIELCQIYSLTQVFIKITVFNQKMSIVPSLLD